MRFDRGQATVDYVAIVAVLAIVFGAALASAAVGAPGVVNAVAGQFRHALCLVGGGRCPAWRSKPCSVATTRAASHFAVTAVIVRYDRDRYLLRERMSDGTVRLTVASTHGLGLEGGFGAGARITMKGRPVGAVDEARVAAQLVGTTGKTYVARDGREADALMRAIRAGAAPSEPREEFKQGGVRALANVGIGSSAAGLALDGLAGAMIGYRRDRSSGNVTLTLDAGRNGWGALSVGLGGPAGAVDGSATFGLTLDRERRPIALSVSATGSGSLGATLPLGASSTLRAATVRAGGFSGSLRGRRWELGARLDLRDPEVAAAWARFRRDPASAGAIGALGAAIGDHAQLDVRTYRTAGTSAGGGAGISVGVRLGADVEHTDDRSTLIAASSRPPAGLWEPRIDCVPA